MKTSKKLTILAALAILLAGLAWFSANRQALRSSPQIGKPVLPGFDVNKVDRLCVRDPDNTVGLRATETRWVVTNAFDYPADVSKIRNALLALRDLKIGHVAPNMPPPRDGEGKRVEAFAADGSRLAALTLSPRPDNSGRSRGPGRYVFRDGSGKAFRVKEDLYQFSTRPEDWMDTQILNVPADDITRIEIIPPEGEPTRLVSVAGKLEVEDLAENEQTDSTQLYGVKSALSYLRFHEIADPALDDAETGLDHPARFSVHTKDHKVYTVLLGNSPTNQTGRYARIRVAPAPELSSKPDSEPETEDDSEIDREALLKEIETLNERLSGWTFLLPSYNAQNMTRKHEELVKPVPEAERDNEPPEAEAPEADAPEAEAPEADAPKADAPEAEAPPPAPAPVPPSQSLEEESENEF